MKHVNAITRKPAKASLPLSAIITAISSILGVVGQVLATKDGTTTG